MNFIPYHHLTQGMEYFCYSVAFLGRFSMNEHTDLGLGNFLLLIVLVKLCLDLTTRKNVNIHLLMH